jgi:protein phosphatase-4 regulatory subunit 3
MSADDAAKKPASIEFNNTEKSSADPTSAPRREEHTIGGSHSLGESGLPKPAENGHADLEVESRDITEAGGVVKGEIEALGEGTEPSSESFLESGDSSETIEAAEGVLAWSPEEDHEHKRVKVCDLSYVYHDSFRHDTN